MLEPSGGLMKPHLTMLTIGVDDLERAVAFYRDGLKLPTQGIVGQEFEYGAVAFFALKGGLRLALFPRDNIAHDSGLPRSGRGATEFTLGHNVRSEAEVDAVMKEAEAAGAQIVKPAQKTFYGGYAGYFQDPDGHLWEVVHNPDFLPPD
jgi:catechol 2,3-dioxygenase-like lactoylglutathione lyase family enzyme